MNFDFVAIKPIPYFGFLGTGFVIGVGPYLSYITNVFLTKALAAKYFSSTFFLQPLYSIVLQILLFVASGRFPPPKTLLWISKILFLFWVKNFLLCVLVAFFLNLSCSFSHLASCWVLVGNCPAPTSNPYSAHQFAILNLVLECGFAVFRIVDGLAIVFRLCLSSLVLLQQFPETISYSKAQTPNESAPAFQMTSP